MISDINAFIGKWPYWPVRATSPGQVAAELRGWRIDRAEICSTRSELDLIMGGNILRLTGVAA